MPVERCSDAPLVLQGHEDEEVDEDVLLGLDEEDEDEEEEDSGEDKSWRR